MAHSFGEILPTGNKCWFLKHTAFMGKAIGGREMLGNERTIFDGMSKDSGNLRASFLFFYDILWGLVAWGVVDC